MTAAQTNLYFWEWGRVRAFLLEKGCTAAQADAKRHELHRKALGSDKSSKAFTNADLDKVIAAFRAVHDGGNLDAQLRQIEQPQARHADLLRRCDAACWSMYNDGKDNRMASGDVRQRYIAGTARKVIGKAVEECTDAELGKVLGCLEARAERLKRDAANPF